jgi:hypothetical protein
MLLPFLLIAATHSLKSLDQRVTFETSAELASVALADLSKIGGAHLQVSPALKDEMLVLRLQEVPLGIALEKIADVCTARWIASSEGFVLTRPAELIREVERKDREVRLARIKKCLTGRLTDLIPYHANSLGNLHDLLNKPSVEGGDQMAAMESMETQMKQLPDPRFMARVLNSLGAELLADLPEDKRIVFSNDPTPMQAQLPPACMNLIDGFVKENNLWAKTIAEKTAAVIPDQDQTTDLPGSFHTGRMPRFWAHEIRQTPTKMLVVLRRFTDVISFEFRLVDSKGKYLSQNTNQSSCYLQTYEGAWQPPAKKTPHAAVIKYSPTAKLLADQSVADETEIKRDKPLPKEALEPLLHPEQVEPLDLFPSEPILRSAEIQNINVVACVDDNDFDMSITPPVEADAVLDQLLLSLDSAKLEHGWFTSKPRVPFHTLHLNRTALGKLVRSTRQEGRLTLEALADYSHFCPENFYGSLGRTYANVLIAEATTPEWDYVRLYGTLGAADRNALGTLTVRAMTPLQKSIVEDIVFGSETSPAQDDTGAEDDLPVESSILQEPTQLLPHGLDADIALSMKQVSKRVVFVTAKIAGDDRSDESEGDPETIAMRMYFTEMERSSSPEQSEKILGYRLGLHRTVSLTLSLPRNRADSSQLDDIAKQGGPLLTYSQLPADIIAEIARELAELKKGDGGGGEPPPIHPRTSI